MSLVHKSGAARILLALAVAFSILHSFDTSGASLSLVWNPSPSPGIFNYIVNYGTSSGQSTYNLSAGTNTNSTVTGLTPGQTYYFAVTAYSPSDGLSGDSNQITNTIPPQILSQPTSQSAIIGELDILSVQVASVAPVSFQWFFNGAAIEGATNSVLILPEVSQANAGKYTVVVSNAGGSVTSQVATLTVVDSALSAVQSGILPPLANGVYNGLFFQTNSSGSPVAAAATTGFLANCTIGPLGLYSGHLALGGQTFAFSGLLNSKGEISTILNLAPFGLSNLDLTLFAVAALGKVRVTGTVSNMSSAGPWVSLITASLATNAYSPTADFVYLSPPPPGLPATNFTCQLVISANGSATLAGKLGDGTAISQTAPIGADKSFPVYQSLYNNTGLLAGWLTLAEGAPVGNLTWIEPGNPAKKITGFTNIVSFGSGPNLSTNCFQLIP